MAGGGVSKNIWNCFRTAPAWTGQPLTCSTSGMGFSGVIIISQQAQIAQLRKESDAINKKITAAKQLNDEYTRLLSSDDEAEYMEKIAIEKLGYAYPNERRFYIVNNSD